jgi:ADP-ribosylation factor GTPase-activating protein 2/3
VIESTTARSKSHTSRFEYVENIPSAGSSSEESQAFGHVAPPKSSNFFGEFGMDSGYQKKPSSSSSKVQVMFQLTSSCIIYMTMGHEYVILLTYRLNFA